jgi:translation initiation factor 5
LKKGVEEEVVWFTDTSKEAAEARRAEELRAMGHAVDLRDRVDAILTSSTVGEVSTGDDAALVTLQKFIEENKDINEIVGEVHRLSLAKSMSTDERFALMVNGLLNFEKPKLLISQIEQYAEALRSFAATPDDASRLMSVFEKNIGVEHPKLLPKFAVVLQALYENDVFEDEAILNWYNSPVETSWAVSRSVAEELRSSAKPFIDWLNSEDGEDESDFE